MKRLEAKMKDVAAGRTTLAEVRAAQDTIVYRLDGDSTTSTARYGEIHGAQASPIRIRPALVAVAEATQPAKRDAHDRKHAPGQHDLDHLHQHVEQRREQIDPSS